MAALKVEKKDAMKVVTMAGSLAEKMVDEMVVS